MIHGKFRKFSEIEKAKRKFDENYNNIIKENEKHNFVKKFEDFYNKIQNFKNQELYNEFMKEFSFRIDLLNEEYHTHRISKEEYLKKLNHKASQLEILVNDIKNQEDIEKYIKILLKQKVH